ncbi:MAG: methyltransferase domain-containing protein [Pirellulales bacterium]|nr:methyltransferase domain-containing protein [Pirellulales bacterium]
MSHRLFFREFLRNYHTTGAILPSGRQLAAALSRFVAQDAAEGRRILEVGPGTGAVTRRIIAAMQPDDALDLAELNESFVRQLERHFRDDPHFRAVAARSKIINRPVQDLPAGEKYDLIVSGLPLNNFSAELVRSILDKLLELLEPGGTLSFFEYIAVRRARSLLSGKDDRERLRGIGRAMRAVLDEHEFRREAILLNVPPAWVHHVRVCGRQ